ncbi:MAG TPA: glycosyltransferase [Candidatus Lokiarchaeia archaeon]|nr:glycosyltransferase [Candidatus Lokiarchaeia archaeon]
MKKALGCDFLFFYSGRLDPSKNLVRIIRAFSLVNTMVNYRFVIAGNGELKEYLNKLINRLNLKDKITLVGFISDDSLVSYMNSADVIVYLTINEPFGLVPIEAMVHGKPSLVSSSGGPSETVVNSETGFLANPLDIKDIKTKIEYILNHRDMLNTMSNFCTQTYEQKFTLEKGVDRFLQALLH